MDNGAWVCNRCVKKLGGFGTWDDRIKTMGRAEAYDVLFGRKQFHVTSGNTQKKINLLRLFSILFFIVVGVALYFVATIPNDPNGDIYGKKSAAAVVVVFGTFALVVIGIIALIKRVKEARVRRAHKKSIEIQQNEEFARKKRAEEEERRHWKSTDEMTGIQFEQYCAKVLKRDHEFVRVEFTKTSGDYGGDLVAYHKDGNKWVIQCKRYSGHVGIYAVQEVLGAKTIYDADRMAVMTNNVLTASAKELARKSGVLVKENIKGSMRFD